MSTARPPRPDHRTKNASEGGVPMNAFRHKVQAANQTAICSAGPNVGRRTLREIFQSGKYSVPIFQRRYCWAETQWKTLLKDAIQALGQHSLGRLTCTKEPKDHRSCILDGQQRFTTATILLASIRDHLQKIDPEDCMIASINVLLFPDTKCLENWLANPSATPLEEGVELPFARLTPTFCDRLPYYTAILPLASSKNNLELSNSSWHRPLKAKIYFDKFMKGRNREQLHSVGRAVLDSFHMLYFPITIDHGHQDGTEDLMVVYERLALRDATFCKPHRESEYLPMDGADMIRNLLLGSFHTESEAIAYYKEYWLPVERAVSKVDADWDMKRLIEAFLADKTYDERPATLVGGQTYTDFQSWLFKDMTDRTGASKDYILQAKYVASELLRLVSGR